MATLKEVQNKEMDVHIESKEPCLKCRYIIVLVGFAVFFFLNGYRINMSVSIVAMVNNSASDRDHQIPVSDSCPDLLMNRTEDSVRQEVHLEEGEFSWSPKIQGYILGSYYLSYLILQIPFGKMVERFGGKWILFWGSLFAAVATLGIPLAAKLHAYAVIACQVLRGIGQGTFQTAFAVLSANWFPKMERGLLYTLLQTGAPLGTFLGSIFSGLLCESIFLGGWTSSFYAFGIGGLVLSVAVAFFIYENPSTHPRISKAELKYILSHQENTLTKRRPKTPWNKIVRSVPVYALAVGCFGQLWATAQFLIVHSTFLGTILHYPIEQNGYFSAVPFLLMFLFANVSSWISSFLMKRKYINVDQARKFSNSISCLGYSASLLGVYFAGCNRFWCNIFSSLSMGFAGFGHSGVWIASTDMTPTFSASIKAIACTFGLLPSFILPLLVGYMTNEMQTIEQWHKVFFITIGIVMASGAIFFVFGSAHVQPWNYIKDSPDQHKDKETRF